MSIRIKVLVVALLIASASMAAERAPFDAAAAFGAREGVLSMSLSPDGKSVAYIAPNTGQGSVLWTLDLAEGSKSHPVIGASGKPDRLEGCHWVSADRLACEYYAVVKSAIGPLDYYRIAAVDRSGKNLQQLSSQEKEYARDIFLGGGAVTDWLPDQDGMVLMTRAYSPDTHMGSHIGSTLEGWGVDLVDTRNLSSKNIEKPGRDVIGYLSDGRGVVRIVGRRGRTVDDQDSGTFRYEYRKQDSREWLLLGTFNAVDGSGFEPLAVDHDLNIAYGRKKLDGRWAIYSIALDGSLAENLVYARPDVDVTGLFEIGRRNRVVGASYSTEYGQVHLFDPDISRLIASLSRALPNQPNLRLVDSSVDEQVLLIHAGSDDDPGTYYVFDRAARKLRPLLASRDELEDVKLAKVKPVTYAAADGTMIPGYLTLPPGKEDAKGLPAIVLPHGGPSARDYWGFDWLAQFLAARGFAVLQPNFRGSAGYGDAWLRDKGFKSWRIAIGDVLDGGHWLVSQGIADPARLAIVGWSYGGYAALQSAVTEPDLFKAVIAIAPVTDLDTLKEEHRHWSDFRLISDEIGDGPHVREGSPARNAEKIKSPVLLFHGRLDRNVDFYQSELMQERLTKAGAKAELVSWDDLDHHLEDSSARTQMLRRIDDFLRKAGVAAAP